jgi:hypothetical protein
MGSGNMRSEFGENLFNFFVTKIFDEGSSVEICDGNWRKQLEIGLEGNVADNSGCFTSSL